jgi:hypothetical protein
MTEYKATTTVFSGLMEATGLDRYSRVGIMVFAAYATGLMLYALSVHFGAILSTAVSSLFFALPKLRPFRNNLAISQNPVWRTVAATFLGSKLTPAAPSLPGSSLKTTSLNYSALVPPAILCWFSLKWKESAFR